MDNKVITILGGGLAGCEAALTLAERGAKVRLVEMRPVRPSPVHATDDLAEIVCSNSLGTERPQKAPGVLKAELAALGSSLIAIAKNCQVPAGQSLAVDRVRFGRLVTERLERHPNVTLVREEAVAFPDGPAIIATGPVTSDAFAEVLKARLGNSLYFYDAVAPIVAASSIDFTKGFFGSRYEDATTGRCFKGEPAVDANATGKDGPPSPGDYFNIPLVKEEFDRLADALTGAEIVPLNDFDQGLFFESCLPVEEMMRRGRDTIRFGPMKPIGFSRIKCTFKPHAVLQLRRETAAGDAFNLVGFQTRMKFGEQTRVLRLIPGFENVEILRHGVMHRNFYLYSPGLLAADLSLKSDPLVYFAGQMTGVEGYTESIMTGLLAALNLWRRLNGKSPHAPDLTTMTGALLTHVATPRAGRSDFVPMNANFGIVDLGHAPTKHARAQARETFYERSTVEVLKFA